MVSEAVVNRNGMALGERSRPAILGSAVCRIGLAISMVTLTGCALLPGNSPQSVHADGSFATRATAFTETLMLAPADADTFTRRCDAAHAEIVAMRDELAGRSGRATQVDLQDYDAMERLLKSIGFGEASIVGEANPDATLRAAGDQCQQKMSELASNISLSRPIYDRLQAIDRTTLGEREAYLLDRTLADFRLSGVDRDAATRARIEALNAELTALSLEFGKTMREARRTLSVGSVDELAGLPADYIAAHAPGEDGRIEITTAYPDVFPILNYADSESLRHDVLLMFRNRAYPDNVETLRAMLEKRAEFAALLGFDSWAAFALADKMTGSPERAQGFLDRLEAAARPAGLAEYQRLLAKLRETDPDARAVPEWSSSYLTEQIKRSDYALDAQELRGYFAFDNVRAGIITLVEDLFEVEVRDWSDAPIWHDSVSAHELFQDGQLIGRFFLDMHPRDGKFSHAAAFPIRTGPTSAGVPVAALICNFPQGGHDTGLMEHSQVETFLHEFGHLIHQLFSAPPDYQALAMDQLEWDFIEAPSQMLEEWVWNYDTLAKFAVNAEGEVIPRPLVDKMNAARFFDLGLTTLRQLTYANVSLNYYNRPPAEVDFKAMWDKMDSISPIERMPEGHAYASFGHLDGYSAFYYTYQWSLAISKDLFSQFKAHGLRDVATAQRYRKLVLEAGSSKPADALIRDFLGRDWSVDAYEQSLIEAASPKPVL